MTTNQKQGSRQTKETSQKPRPAGPVGQGPVALMEAANLEVLQRAAIKPSLAAPADILALQRAYGNQAVQRLLGQRKSQKVGSGCQVRPVHGAHLTNGRVPPYPGPAITVARPTTGGRLNSPMPRLNRKKYAAADIAHSRRAGRVKTSGREPRNQEAHPVSQSVLQRVYDIHPAADPAIPLSLHEREYGAQRLVDGQAEIQFPGITSCIGIVGVQGNEIRGVHLGMLGPGVDDIEPPTSVHAEFVKKYIGNNQVRVFGETDLWKSAEALPNHREMYTLLARDAATGPTGSGTYVARYAEGQWTITMGPE
jgi:hypothetical protein